jgi:hypothetical protein
MEIDPNVLTLIINGIRNILGGLRDAKEMLPEGKAKQEIEAKIKEADSARIEAEINLAQAWGYPICRRTFPPVIMLKVDDDPETGDYRFRCPDCGDEHPPKLPPSLDWRSPLLDR